MGKRSEERGWALSLAVKLIPVSRRLRGIGVNLGGVGESRFQCVVGLHGTDDFAKASRR